MKYYLKKCWPTVTAASICMVVAYGLQVCTSLVQIQITQGLLDGDLRAFTIRIILLLLTWLAVVLCLIAETFFQGRAVRRMNNALRRDMAAGCCTRPIRSIISRRAASTSPSLPTT